MPYANNSVNYKITSSPRRKRNNNRGRRLRDLQPRDPCTGRYRKRSESVDRTQSLSSSVIIPTPPYSTRSSPCVSYDSSCTEVCDPPVCRHPLNCHRFTYHDGDAGCETECSESVSVCLPRMSRRCCQVSTSGDCRNRCQSTELVCNEPQPIPTTTVVETKEETCIPENSDCDLLDCLVGNRDCSDTDLLTLVFTNTLFLVPCGLCLMVLSIIFYWMIETDRLNAFSQGQYYKSWDLESMGW